MKTYKTQAEVDADLKDGSLILNDDVTFECDFSIPGDIYAGDIKALDINAGDINAGDIKAGDICYYAVCVAYRNIICKSIEGRKENARHFVLDGEIKIRQ